MSVKETNLKKIKKNPCPIVSEIQTEIIYLFIPKIYAQPTRGSLTKGSQRFLTYLDAMDGLASLNFMVEKNCTRNLILKFHSSISC